MPSSLSLTVCQRLNAHWVPGLLHKNGKETALLGLLLGDPLLNRDTKPKAKASVLIRVSCRCTQWAPHYDHQPNILIQLYGIKRVVLLPHAAHPSLRLLQDPAHPGYRHTTLSFDDLLHQGADRGQARPGDILGTAVNLKAGEALFLPPKVIHTTIGITDFNVALNRFSTV